MTDEPTGKDELSERELFDLYSRRLMSIIPTLTDEQVFALGWMIGRASQGLPPEKEKAPAIQHRGP